MDVWLGGDGVYLALSHVRQGRHRLIWVCAAHGSEARTDIRKYIVCAARIEFLPIYFLFIRIFFNLARCLSRRLSARDIRFYCANHKNEIKCSLVQRLEGDIFFRTGSVWMLAVIWFRLVFPDYHCYYRMLGRNEWPRPLPINKCDWVIDPDWHRVRLSGILRLISKWADGLACCTLDRDFRNWPANRN